MAAAILRLEIEGVSGAELANVQAALAFPPGLVQNETVDQRWLQRFVDQLPATVNKALQPFGYYRSNIETELQEIDSISSVLKVLID
ncbi:MAG: outer membrane protein assembly factor, partial [Desulfuromonadaceae bacterium]|nr:outer membrane protein assembly factor [Desulfuromonadaceae bacterium]